MKGNVIRYVKEFRSSRLCARCFTPFPLNTLSHRFKVCDWCLPDQDDWPDTLKLPSKIVSKKCKRKWRSERGAAREAAREIPNQGIRFVSKVNCYRKIWQQNEANDMDDNVGIIYQDEYTTEYAAGYGPKEHHFDLPPVLKTVWHRDITAAKLILYRGNSMIKLKLKLK